MSKPVLMSGAAAQYIKRSTELSLAVPAEDFVDRSVALYLKEGEPA
jgi:hypothetical protein